MALTYEPIQSNTLTSSSNSVTFSSISSAYTDLILVISGSTTASTGAYNLRFNGDTGSNYSITGIYANSASAGGSFRASNATKLYLGDGANTSMFMNIIHIMNYTNTTTNKTVLNRKTQITSSSIEAIVGLWRSTAAINSITLLPDSNNFATGTVFTIYGLKAA